MDDTLEIINRRIELFREGSLPLVDYYEFRDRLLRIDGNASANQVQQEIAEALQGID
jgi:adenylate kinase